MAAILALSRATAAVQSCLRRHGCLRTDRTALIAVSGGGDSAGLLAACAALPAGVRPVLVVAHVDHGLHPAARQAALATSRQAARCGLPYRLLTVDPADRPGPRPGSEAWSRTLRYGLLTRLAGELEASAVLTAHQQDDVVETLLLRLLRGSGTRGLAAIPESRLLTPTGPWLLRPLLDLSRAALRDAATAGGLHEMIVEDPTNADRRFLRNQVRHELLPALVAEQGEEIGPLLARLARLLRRLEEETDELLAPARAAARLAPGAPGGLRLPLAVLRGLPPALRGALLLDLLHRLTPGHEPRRVHVRALLRLTEVPGAAHADRSTDARRWCLPGGATAVVGPRELTLRRRGEASQPGAHRPPGAAHQAPGTPTESIGGGIPPAPLVVATTGSWTLPGVGRLSIEAADHWPSGLRPASEDEAWIDVEVAPLPWSLRPIAPGERMLVHGGPPCLRSLDGLLQAAHVPAEMRARWPLLVADGRPLWLVGVRRAAHALLGSATSCVLRVRLFREAAIEGDPPGQAAPQWVVQRQRKVVPIGPLR